MKPVVDTLCKSPYAIEGRRDISQRRWEYFQSIAPIVVNMRRFWEKPDLAPRPREDGMVYFPFNQRGEKT